MMDLMNILVNPNEVNKVCCLCYKKSENTTGLHDDIEIHDEYFDVNSTLENLIKSLFPTLDVLLTHVCEECSTLILKTFSLFHRSFIKHEILNLMVDNLNEQAEEMECELFLKKNLKKCRLKINLPTNESIMNYRKPNDYVQCEKCQMKFRLKLLLKKHIHMAHKNTNNAIICDICGKVFSKNSMLKAHLGCHQQKQCPYCNKVFKSHSHFNLHVKNHETTTKIKRRVKYLKCNYCNYQSVTKTTLEAHVNKVHLHIKPFTCEICHKGFYKKDNLAQHSIGHNKVKDKTCDICGETFVIERTLQEHLRLHTGEKPYKCEICNIGFTTSGRRLEHMKRKHMDKNESCLICGKKFSLKKDLNSHLKKVHGSPEFKNVLVRVDLGDNQSEVEVVKLINYT